MATTCAEALRVGPEPGPFAGLTRCEWVRGRGRIGKGVVGSCIELRTCLMTAEPPGKTPGRLPSAVRRRAASRSAATAWLIRRPTADGKSTGSRSGATRHEAHRVRTRAHTGCGAHTGCAHRVRTPGAHTLRSTRSARASGLSLQARRRTLDGVPDAMNGDRHGRRGRLARPLASFARRAVAGLLLALAALFVLPALPGAAQARRAREQYRAVVHFN